MTQYIDKDSLVAEIENIRKHYIERDDCDNGWNFALDKIISLVDTIEAKEVDLEEEIELEYNPFDGLPFEVYGGIAKHFFELGLKTKM